MDQMLVPFDFHRLPPLLCLKTELLLNCPKLGKGTLGMAYKAILEDAATMVVKRLKDVGAGKEEFEQQMEIVGSIKHKNVVELRAYYYSKDEKLIVSDYFSEGSVAEMLHVYKISSESSGGK